MVGAKKGRSLALIIPARLVQEYHISPSTVFAIRHDVNTRKIMLQQTGHLERNEKSKLTEQPLARPTQQAIRTH